MELQDRQSYFRQVSAAMVGLGCGVFVATVDYMAGVLPITGLSIFGGALCMALGIIGWVLAKTVIK